VRETGGDRVARGNERRQGEERLRGGRRGKGRGCMGRGKLPPLDIYTLVDAQAVKWCNSAVNTIDGAYCTTQPCSPLF